MKILFLTSFYSGLKESVESGKWNPSGMPAIYKLLEGLKNKKIAFDYCFIDKNGSTLRGTKLSFFKETKFYILGCKLNKKTPKIITKISFKLIYLIKIYSYLKKINVKQYDIVYIDRANVSAFLVIHYFFKIKGVLRIHGIGLQYYNFKKSKIYYLKNILNLISYRLPFKNIIASRDGTPIDKFLKEFTNKKTKKIILLNGTDSLEPEPKKYNRKNEIINFLFVGRLEKDKGIIEILKCFHNHKLKDKIFLTIIGDGSLQKYVKKYAFDQNHIDFVGTLPHDEVSKYYLKSDVFISFNHLGNISNVVLEAIKNNLLIITFEKDLESIKDIDSNRFLGNNVMYVDRNKSSNSLNIIINSLIKDKDILSEYKLRVKRNLQKKIPSWNERIDKEIEIILN